MKRFLVFVTAAVALHAALFEPVSGAPAGGRGGAGGGGRGGPGGGGGGGGPGGGRPGGGGGAGTPSMSRPNGSPVSKPSPGPGGAGPGGAGARPPGGGQPGGRPNPSAGQGERPGANNPGLNNPGANNRGPGGANRGPGSNNFGPSAADMNKRPSANDLNNFLDLPGGSSASRPGEGGAGTRNPGAANAANRINNGDRPANNRLNPADGNNNIGNRADVNRQNNINSIQNKYQDVNNRPFDNNYWGRYGDNAAWRWNTGWGRYGAYWAWNPATWATMGAFLPYAWANPVAYDYGTNVVYRDNYVYVNDQQAASAADYYQQAGTIASAIPATADPKSEDWLPLGVFAIAEDDMHHDTGNMMQLAVSKDGIIAGTFYNETTQSNRPLQGTVDKNSQRAAWKFADGKNSDIVMETAISNLTKDQSTALVHMDANTTQTWNLVRMNAPKQ